MPDTRSDAFRCFLDSFEGPVDTRERAERFDLEALAELTGVERDQAESLLLARLREPEPDGRVPAALAQLGTPGAIAALREALDHHAGSMQLAILHALSEVEPVEDAVARLVEVLRDGGKYARIEATTYLAQQPGKQADEALFLALRDPDDGVRISAIRSLIRKHGLLPLEETLQGRFNALTLGAWSGLSSVREPSLVALREVMDGLAAGRTPQELGLVYTGEPDNEEIRRFTESYHTPAGTPGPWQDRLDVDALRALSPQDRPWAIQMLIKAVEGTPWGRPDPRAARAMAELGWPEFITPLGELLPRLTGPMTAEVVVALGKLTGEPKLPGR